MFLFEDPVAVDLVQRGNTLTGLGCDAGLPDPALDIAEFCAPLTGKVEADRAWFGFAIPGYRFHAAVTVSRDASRMAGEFDDVAGTPHESAWLRLSDDERGLAGRRSENPPPQLLGRYEFRLLEALSPGTAFDPLRTYVVNYLPEWGMYGDFGAFYVTEIDAWTSSGPIQVGPVPATDPSLPVSIRLEREAADFTHATVVDARGVVSEFELAPATP